MASNKPIGERGEWAIDHDPEDLADQLHERSENISAARDAAFERGQDYYAAGQNQDDCDEAAARYFDHPKLQADFCAGWREAASDEPPDDYAERAAERADLDKQSSDQDLRDAGRGHLVRP